jgi:hypothetical protein
MSRKSKAEYIGEKRRAYESAKPAKRSRILSEVRETLGYTRKYVNKLLTGNIRYRERKGRGKTYKDEVLAAARTLWEAVGCPCTTYFVLELPRIVREYEECVALIKPMEVKPALLELSASTLDRAFKGLTRVKPFLSKSNRRSGRNRPLLDAIECKSGEEVMACRVAPGDTQIDTVAHCGGDMSDNFFWTLTQTDRNTQWTEITPTWNRGMHSTVEALLRLERRFPFPVTSEHGDNGPEFINYAMAGMQGGRKHIALSRSRPYRKNDNAHVEQKNGSVVRELFGEMRLDCKDLEGDLVRLERDWSDYCNFFRRTKMIVSKGKKADGKGYARKYQEGGPRTPCQRVIESGILSQEQAEALTGKYRSMNGVQLYQSIVRHLKRIANRQEAWRTQIRQRDEVLHAARVAASARRAAPAGPAYAPCLLDGIVDLRTKPLSAKKRKSKSVQQLTNQKQLRQSQGALSI